MAEPKKPEPKPSKPELADLAPASESCHASVHRLLAVRANRSAVGDDVSAAEATAALAKLGYR